jgi:hypothetical protein
VLAVEKEVEEPTEVEIAKFRASQLARGLNPNDPMWAGHL